MGNLRDTMLACSGKALDALDAVFDVTAWRKSILSLAQVPPSRKSTSSIQLKHTLNDTASGTAWQQQIAVFPTISGTGIGIGAQFHFRFFRDGTDAADTYNDGAVIATFGIHYQVDTMGGRQIATK